MKLFKYLFLILFISNCVIQYGCKKKEAPIDYIPQQLRDYGIFQLGSYWVYKNEMNGKIDSSYIKYPPIYSYTHWGGYDTDPIVEDCRIYFGGNFIDQTAINTTYKIDFRTWGSICLIYEYLQPGSIFNYEGSIYRVIANIDTLELNSKIYNHVLITQFNSPQRDKDTAKFTYYLVKYIGLVKCTKHINNTDTTWSLLKYNVIN